MLLNVLANNTTAFLFYFEGSNPFLPFFSIFIYKCNAYNNYNVNKAVYFKGFAYLLYIAMRSYCSPVERMSRTGKKMSGEQIISVEN